MSTSYISAELRRLVVARARSLCEYCLIAEEDTTFGCAADHIISEKHLGITSEENLALACVFCNQAKGSDVGSIDQDNGQFLRLFNPRLDRWNDHFTLNGDRIDGISPIGKVTARLLGFNRVQRILERRLLREIGRYPSIDALNRINS